MLQRMPRRPTASPHTPEPLTHAFKRENRAMPLYHQVEQLIRFRITKGEYRPGQQIPSESEFCRELGVSRITVREALRELVHEKILRKVQGKGTYVASHQAVGLPPIKYAGFIDEIYERVRKLSIKTVEMSNVPVTEDVRSILKLPPAVSEITRIKRLRWSGDEPFSFTVNYLPIDIGARIKPQELYTVPLLAMLEDDLKIPVIRAEETVEAAPADPEISARLGIPALYPVMHIKRIMFTKGDVPFEVVESYYRADKYQYSVTLSRVKRDGKWRWSPQRGDQAKPPRSE